MTSIPLAPSGPSASRRSVPPVFERIGIVGLGPIGRAIGRAARRVSPSALVIGVDRNDALECAMQQHAVDVGGADLTMLKEADLIVLTGSVEGCAEVLTTLQEYVPGTAVVTATCGDAPQVMEAARALPPRMAFVASLLVDEHVPGGASPADAGGIGGSRWCVLAAPDDTQTGMAGARLRAFVSGLGVGVPA